MTTAGLPLRVGRVLSVDRSSPSFRRIRTGEQTLWISMFSDAEISSRVMPYEPASRTSATISRSIGRRCAFAALARVRRSAAPVSMPGRSGCRGSRVALVEIADLDCGFALGSALPFVIMKILR